MRLRLDGWTSDNLVRFVGSPGGMAAGSVSVGKGEKLVELREGGSA